MRSKCLGQLSALGAGIGLGAGLMFMLDPRAGGRRRSTVRDKAVSYGKHAAGRTSKLGRDLGNRAQGLVSETKARLRREEVPDEILVERVRAQLGRAVSHPRGVEVSAKDGCVTLNGAVLEGEAQRLISRVATVRGVCEIDDRLAEHGPEIAQRIPGLQGGDRMMH